MTRRDRWLIVIAYALIAIAVAGGMFSLARLDNEQDEQICEATQYVYDLAYSLITATPESAQRDDLLAALGVRPDC